MKKKSKCLNEQIQSGIRIVSELPITVAKCFFKRVSSVCNNHSYCTSHETFHQIPYSIWKMTLKSDINQKMSSTQLCTNIVLNNNS